MRVIISGWSRNGTTITRNIINALPNAYITNESRLYNLVIVYDDFLNSVLKIPIVDTILS